MRIFGFGKKSVFHRINNFIRLFISSSMKFQCCICVPDVVKDFLNVNAFNLMSGTDETRYI